MSRIPLDHPRTPLVRLAEWYSRRRFGKVLDPVRAMLHHRGVLLGLGRLEGAVGRWRALDETPKALAVMAAAATVECGWCIDFGYWHYQHGAVDPAKLADVPRWRESDVYTPLERQAMAYAEAMTATPPAVSDEMVAGLREHLSDAVVELTAMVALGNMRARTNAALGLAPQGFREVCAR